MLDIKIHDPPTSPSLISLNGFCGRTAPCFLLSLPSLNLPPPFPQCLHKSLSLVYSEGVYCLSDTCPGRLAHGCSKKASFSPAANRVSVETFCHSLQRAKSIKSTNGTEHVEPVRDVTSQPRTSVVRPANSLPRRFLIRAISADL